MLKKFGLIKAILGIVIVVSCLPNPKALALPLVSITNGSGNSVSITVSGANYNQSVDLVYVLPNSSLQTVISNIGTTYGGTWTGNINLTDYGILSGSQVFVRVGGQPSNTITVGSGYYGGCTSNCGSSSGLSLSQNLVNVAIGQTQAVTVYNYGNGFYVSANSNSNIASASVSGNQVDVYGLTSGTTNISVCSNSWNYACATLYVTVQGGGFGSANIWFSPSSPSLYIGQSLAVSINSSVSALTYANPSNAYYISSNSNSNAVTASISGTVLNLYGNQSGNSTINICHSSLNFCNTLYVSVSGSGISNLLSFSEDFSNINLYQTRSISVYYNNIATSNFYISSNSNPSIVNATANGTSVNLYGQNNGSSTINICHSTTSVCKSLFVNVGNGYSTGNLTFSQQNVNLNYAQNVNINIYGGNSSGSYYISSNSNPSVVNASISGSSVYLYGQSQGTSTIVVCQNNSVSCGSLFVSVYGNGGGNGSGVWFSQTNPNVGLFQNLSVNIYSNISSNYYLSSNSNSNVITASVVGNTLNLYGRSTGNANIVVCHSTASNLCGTLYVSVGGGYGGSGNLFLSQNSLNLSVGQSASITAYNTANSIYVSSNSNPQVAGANVNNTTINVYASNPGSTSIVVCQNGASSCATLSVNVDGYSSGNLSLQTSNLPNLVIGQFYNYQLQVSGGNSPYNFSLVSGNLPSGLNLSSSGIISGITNTAGSFNFSIRVNDNFGRTTTGNFNLNTGSVLGTSIYKNGQLIKEGNTIYIVYRNSKTGFANLAAFNGFGFKLANVVSVFSTGLNASGYTITTANGSHPWGSWIKSGNTVYFVHETGLIPVPDWNTFINNGGLEQNIVPANIKDFTLPILSVMVSDDNRLR